MSITEAIACIPPALPRFLPISGNCWEPSCLTVIAADGVAKLVRKKSGNTFASVLEAGLGKTICRDFYFPYARKIWGVDPEQLSAVQARRRVSSGSLGKMARKVISAVPGFKPKGSGRYFYPR